MRFHHVCVEHVATVLPDEVVTSAEIEERLRPVYERLHLPEGRLELMTGIRERRFFPPGTLPGQISGQAARRAIAESGIDPAEFGVLVHGSVCRDQMEPATAAGVHHAAGLSDACMVLDISNACLGLLNGMHLIASMIELGQIRAGVVVGTETGRGLVEGTIESLLAATELTRKDFKQDFASLTIGSCSAAIVLCDDRLSRHGHRLVGGSWKSRTSTHQLCAGGATDGSGRLRMATDSEALLHAGVELATEAWQETRQVLGWQTEDLARVFTHQVGRQHRKLLFERLELPDRLDFPTVEFLGNTGAAALPAALGLGIEQNTLHSGDKVALLGIGSGLNSLMLGIEW